MPLSLLKVNQTLPGYYWEENLLVAVLPTLTHSPEIAAHFPAPSSVTATTATLGWAGAPETCIHPNALTQYLNGGIS